MPRFSRAPAPLPANAQPESHVLAAVLLSLGSRRDVRLFRANTGAATDPSGRLHRFGTPGQPDLMGWIQPEGWWLGVECKTAKGRLSLAQRRYRAAAERGGCCYLVARSADEATASLDAWLARRRGATCP